MDGEMDGWMDGWIDKWIDRKMGDLLQELAQVVETEKSYNLPSGSWETKKSSGVFSPSLKS